MTSKVKRPGKRELSRYKRLLRERGITYVEIARMADRSWFTVWAALKGHRHSPHIINTIQKMLGNGAAA